MDSALDRLKQLGNAKPMMGQGKKGARIMIVQESPYEAELKRGQYMGGKAGRMLRTALGEVGIDVDDVYFTAIVKHTTPEDRLPLPDEIKESMDLMWAEIDIVNPDIIVPTGNPSMKALMGVTAITKHRGKLVERDGRKYFPIIHPNLVLKQPKYLDTFSKDIINLASILDGEVPEDIKTFSKERRYCETFNDGMDEIRRLYSLPSGSKIVIDLETVKTNPFISEIAEASVTTRNKFTESLRPKIVAIGFSDRAGYGSAIPLYHRQNTMPGNQIGTIVKALRFLLERADLEFVAHNAKFDIKWLRAQLDVWVQTLNWDTMLIHYLAITEEKGTHGLKDLAWLETDMGGYDDKLDDVKPKGADEGNYDLIDWDVLKVYLADDCDVTFRLLDKWLPLIEDDPEKKWLWYNLMLPGYYALLDIECDGMHIDKEWMKVLQGVYPDEIQRLRERLSEYPEVLEIEREKQDMWAERCAIGLIKKAQRTDEQQMKFEKYKKYDPHHKDGDGTRINFGSSQQLKDLLFNRMGLKTVVLTDKGEYSTNNDSLKYMRNQSPKFIDLLMEFRKAKHLNDNFVQGMAAFIDDAGIIHPSYNIHGTVTGRLSSNEPNAQQFPRKVNDPFLFQYNYEIKKLFNSRFGDDGVIVQFDYSQLELRILAVFTQDPTLIELYRSGADLHREVAADSFGVTLPEVTKDQRTVAKKIQFGIVYQESAKGLSEDLRAEGIDLSVEDCERFIARYFRRFPKVQQWINNIKRFARRNKYVKTLTNRIRHLATIDSTDRSIAAEAERQAVNAPIQSTGSDCTLMSLIQINKWLRESGKRSRICVTVHDSIVLDCPKDEVIEVAKKVKHIMENLAEYNEFYKFLGDVPIVSEMEIGYNYGDAFEATIEQLEEQGIDGFLQAELDSKKKKDKEKYEKAITEGKTIPKFVRLYWEEVA
jgi:uracil-DNA glycosylase family 4